MQWFEILILIGAVALVALPIVLHFVNKKKGKSGCGCDCGVKNCPHCAAASKPEKDNK